MQVNAWILMVFDAFWPFLAGKLQVFVRLADCRFGYRAPLRVANMQEAWAERPVIGRRP